MPTTVTNLLSSYLQCPQSNINSYAQWRVPKTETRTIYQVACPICGHKYALALFDKYDYEFCPLCGYGNSLALFLDEGKRQWTEAG
jgi:hypothetical protein